MAYGFSPAFAAAGGPALVARAFGGARPAHLLLPLSSGPALWLTATPVAPGLTLFQLAPPPEGP